MKVTNTFNLKGEEIAEYIKKRKLHNKENYGISFSNKRVGWNWWKQFKYDCVKGFNISIGLPTIIFNDNFRREVW